MQQLLEVDDWVDEHALLEEEDLGPPSTPAHAPEDVIADRIYRAYQMRTQWDLELMEAVAEAERSEIYADEGLTSVADWVATRLGMGFRRAQEFTEVAVALQSLPRMAEAYRDGRVSYDHLRMLVQVAGPENESDLMEAVEGLTVADTFRLVRKILEVSAEDALDNRRERWLEMRWDHEARQLFVWARLPEDQGAKVERAIEVLARAMPQDDVEPEGHTPMGAMRADALVELADSALADHPSKTAVVVHVEAAALAADAGVAEIEDGPTISPETARRLACDSLLQTVIDGKDGKPIGLGRTRRTVSPRMLRELRRRDRTCRIPGCRRRKLLEAHHIRHWINDGPTDYDNLVLLCETHHFLVHEGGFTIRGDPPKITVERPGLPPLRAGPPRITQEAREMFEWELAAARIFGRVPDR